MKKILWRDKTLKCDLWIRPSCALSLYTLDYFLLSIKADRETLGFSMIIECRVSGGGTLNWSHWAIASMAIRLVNLCALFFPLLPILAVLKFTGSIQHITRWIELNDCRLIICHGLLNGLVNCFSWRRLTIDQFLQSLFRRLECRKPAKKTSFKMSYGLLWCPSPEWTQKRDFI